MNSKFPAGCDLKVLRSRNWGDYIAPFIYRGLSGMRPTTIPMEKESRAFHYLTIGSVLQLCDEYSIVWGSGFLSDRDDLGSLSWRRGGDKVLRTPAEVLAVRGPLTRAKLQRMGVECPAVYGDPALLMPAIYSPTPDVQYELGVIPHYLDRHSPALDRLRNDPKVLIIDIVHPRIDYLRPHRRYLHVIDRILQCEKIVSSSLHGLILADAYRVPAHWLQVGEQPRGDHFKFEDYFGSVKRPTSQLVCQEKLSREDILSRFKSYKWEFESQALLDACPFPVAQPTFGARRCP